MTLTVWRNDIVEWVIAESAEDATTIMVEEIGAHYDDPPEWTECDPATEWTMVEGPKEGPTTKTFREWIESEGRCFLGTTEW